MTNYQAALRAQIVSLQARQKRAYGFMLNQDMQIEADLLQAQLTALRQEEAMPDPLAQIQALMSGQEWDADTLEAIASVVREAGYEVNDLEHGS